MTGRILLLDEECFYDLLSFFVSRAFMLAHGEEDEELYPSLRLIDGANRLTKCVIQSGGLEDAPWPHQFVETCEAGLNLLMTDQEAFAEFITESTRQLADAKRPREQPMPTHDAVEPFSSFRSGGACSVPRPWALPTLPGRGPPVPGDLRSGCLRVQIVI